jgi:DNA-binding response OmpR family regulator
MKALLVAGDRGVGRFIVRALNEEGLSMDVCPRVGDALARVQERLYDLVVLDWALSELHGLAMCRELRRSGSTTPILVLIDRADTHQKLRALEAGADAYMDKPVEIDELVARVRALLRRASGFASLRLGDLAIDPVAHRVRLRDVELALSNRECALLLCLLRRGERVVPRLDLLAHVWGMRFDPGSNLVEVYVSRLRERLGDHAWMIETVRGTGYRLRGSLSARTTA